MMTHWTCWKVAANAWASVGNAMLAMLVSSEDRSIESERPASAPRTDAGLRVIEAAISSGAVETVLAMAKSSRSSVRAERAPFALCPCV